MKQDISSFIEDIAYIPQILCSGLYILSVAMHPNTIKVGWTRNINRRIWNYTDFAPEYKWYSYAILFQFRDCTTSDMHSFHSAHDDEHTFIETELEKACLDALQAYRNYKMSTEWFDIEVDKAIDILKATVENVLDSHFKDLPEIRPITQEQFNFRTNRSSDMRARLVRTQQKKWFSMWKATVNQGHTNAKGTRKENKEETPQWHERDYQTTIIQYCTSQLKSQHRLFLELATGAGKSYIMYKIFRNLDVDCILIFSPRKTINKQNVHKKYLKLLNPAKLYHVVNFSDTSQLNSTCSSIVMVACPQSPHTLQKVKDYIQRNRLGNIFIWFDEGHHTVESWDTTHDPNKHYFIYDETFQYRMFTSASPDVRVIQNQPMMFGELYSPISVSALIAQKWLCTIQPHIFKANKQNVSTCNYNLDHFAKYGRHYGISFHHTRQNATELFLQHVDAFVRHQTSIKPFLLLGNDFNTHTHESLKAMDTLLPYDCFDIETFQASAESIGYVCQKYSMGYDFEKIDYLLLCDPKTQAKDVIQCIGRGTRSDKLGPLGKNKDKTLYVMIPAFIDGADEKNKFYCIRQVLRYLIYDLEIPFNDIVDLSTRETTGPSTNGTKGYNGKASIEAMLLNLLQDDESVSWTQYRLVGILQKHHVHCPTEYGDLRRTRPELFLPEDPFIACNKQFYWELTHKTSPFYTQPECVKRVQAICDTHDLDLDDMDTEDVVRTLHGLDGRIPNMALERFYGVQIY